MTSRFAVAEHYEFQEASLQALGSPNLQLALSRLGETLAAGNRRAFDELPGSSLLRERARQIKEEALSSLDEHLATLESNVQKNGGVVHWAGDGKEACNIVAKIAAERGIRRIVKSKSMVTEEIHLNRHLEAHGYEVTETDFGEYIIQLAGERPSHIVAPVVHKTIEEVAELMNRKLDSDTAVDAKALAGLARKTLRARFEVSEMGISGANFAIAETGSITIISNEGNARLTTTVPRIHVAIVGIEKVLPRLSDLPIFLKILARGATGQKISVYTSLISGPRREGEGDGPEEFHLILLDNGRSRILGSDMRESLFCIRCGACLNICPVYRKIGGHAYGGIYSGPIGAVLTPLYDGLKPNYHQPQASSLCGACQAACPVKIRIPELLVKNRAALQNVQASSPIERRIYSLWSRLLASPRLYRSLVWFSTRIVSRFARNGWFRNMPGPVKGWTSIRDFPAPASRSFRDRWDEIRKHG